jgi:hypothetical protein
MTSLEQALEHCLARLAGGEASLDECLREHPEHAEELRRLLAAARALEAGRGLEPTQAFKSQARARLMAHMRQHPRPPARRGAPGLLPARPLWRLALAALVLALVLPGAATVLAQAALPGQPLYGWKLASEQVWRAFQPDALAADLALAERRAGELLLVAGDPRLEAQGRQRLSAALAVLAQYDDVSSRLHIRQHLAGHQHNLAQAGIYLPELDALVDTTMPALPAPATLEPAATSGAATATAILTEPGLPTLMPGAATPATLEPPVETPVSTPALDLPGVSTPSLPAGVLPTLAPQTPDLPGVLTPSLPALP